MPNVIGPEFWYFDRRKVLNEVVFRAPPSIDNYTSLTHLVLIDESLEDVLFQTVVEFKRNDGSNSTLNEWLRDKHTITITQDGNVATLEIQLLGDDGRLSCEKHWLGIYNKLSDIKIYDDKSDDFTYFKQTAVIIDMGFNELIKAQPEKLIFGSYRDIIRSLYQQIAELEAFRRIPFTIDYKRLKKISRCFHELLVDNRLLIRKIITLRILSAMKETKKYPPSLGGIMDKFKKLSNFNSNHDVFDEDVINLELPWENPRLPQLRVRWMRSDRYWTYTFFETTNNLTRLSPDAPSYS